MSDNTERSSGERGESYLRDPWSCYEDEDGNCGSESDDASEDDCCCCCCG